MATQPIRYLAGADVERLLPEPGLQRGLVERAYRSIETKAAETPAAPQLSPRPGAFTYPMPAYVSDGDITSLKWVSDYPKNRERHGLPCVSGLIVINESEAGLPVAIMDSAAITAARTAAVSAVCVAAFAREEWSAVGIIGYGVQARSHIRALSALNPGADFGVFSRRPFADPEPGVSAAVSPLMAVENADVVITGMPLGEKLKPSLAYESLKPTALILPLDDDASLDRDVSTRAEAFYVDALDDYRQRQDAGTFSGWREPDGTVPGAVLDHRAVDGMTVCANQGMGILDAFFADFVLEAAERDGAGALLDR